MNPNAEPFKMAASASPFKISGKKKDVQLEANVSEKSRAEEPVSGIVAENQPIANDLIIRLKESEKMLVALEAQLAKKMEDINMKRGDFLDLIRNWKEENEGSAASPSNRLFADVQLAQWANALNEYKIRELTLEVKTMTDRLDEKRKQLDKVKEIYGNKI